MHIDLDQVKVDCKYRSENHSCTLMDAELGWVHGCSEETCKSCLAKGGPDSPESRDFRVLKQKEWINYVKTHLRSATEQHLKALVQRHLTGEEARTMMADPEVSWALRRIRAWAEARPTWEMAVSFGKALLSRGFTGTKVDLTVRGQRHVSCFGETLEGRKVQEPCPSLALSRDGKHHYCNACGCGDKGLTYLDPDKEGYSKLDYPELHCPRQRPGFSNQL